MPNDSPATPVLTDDDLLRVRSPLGRLHQILGSHPVSQPDPAGVRFAVWAPAAAAVSVVGDFNGWTPWQHPLERRDPSGVWEVLVPEASVGQLYKYRIRSPGGQEYDKTDPCSRSIELRPSNASRIVEPSRYEWGDEAWIRERRTWQPDRSPMSIYEVHLSSWKRQAGADPRAGTPGWLSYRALADELLPYVKETGFTHVELLPVTEHPLDRSWGYQTTGYFAPTSRHGDGDDFRYFVDQAHGLGLGVILDWVPAHFPKDASGLGVFDGSHLYEHADPRKGVHPDWGTYIFNLSRPEVAAFLVSSALYWVEEYHLDGVRIDAVASMLYLDYSRDEGAWVPNRHGGNENLEAVEFLRTLNGIVTDHHPGVMVIAEESTAWPGVTHSAAAGGLAFHAKWNMGWMHDTLEVMQLDPLFRKGSYEKLTFSILYAFSERFVLALSHDEVVHLKGSMLTKMPGSEAQRFANLKALYGYMWGHPGKKLLFMGAELGESREWDYEGSLDWTLLESAANRGLRAWVTAINRLYADEPALHQTDWDGRGFEWIDCHDRDRTVLSFLRWADGWTDPVIVVVNLAAKAWEGFELAVPFPGEYTLLLNSDEVSFGGEGVAAERQWGAVSGERHGRDQYITMTIPALTTVFLKPLGPRSASDDV
ncbi:MAG: 1,4-alpha-glucan branching protein GlgB [Longimicrobiales bacterium]